MKHALTQANERATQFEKWRDDLAAGRGGDAPSIAKVQNEVAELRESLKIAEERADGDADMRTPLRSYRLDAQDGNHTVPVHDDVQSRREDI